MLTLKMETDNCQDKGRRGRAILRALKRWTPSPACLWRILMAEPPSGHRSTRAGW
jgi:hypothetical protein